jgi:hypothetical protein
MTLRFSHPARLLALAAVITGSLLLSACGGGGGGGGSTPPAQTPPNNTNTNTVDNATTVPGVVEGTISGTAQGTITGVVNGTTQGTSTGTITGTSSGNINGTVTGTLTQVVSGSATNTVLNNQQTNTTGTVTGTVNGTVVGTVNGNVSGTVAGTTTGTVTGVVQGSATGTVTAAPVSQLGAQQAAVGFLQAFDAHHASFKNTGATYYAFDDGCALSNGYSKASSIATFDAEPNKQGRFGLRAGSTRANTAVTVLAERTATNPDNTQRREIDIQYSITYTDGSRDQTATSTIISGSSAGSTNPDGSACVTSENKPQWRFYGNQKKIDFDMVAYNELNNRFLLSNGADMTPAETFNNYIQIALRDPANVATYYTIDGPGIRSFSTGQTLTIIGISPRVLRSAPEFAGKVGNAVDWRDIDSFRFCRVSPTNGSFANAPAADCPTNGASSSSFGSFDNSVAATADSNFNTYTFAIGQLYTLRVYNDDGWKTPGGYLSRTPIITMTHTLAAVPYSAAALQSGGLFADPQVTVTSVVGTDTAAAKVAQVLRTKSAFTAQTAWLPPSGNFPDGSVPGLSGLSLFVQGPTSAAVAPATWPRSRNFIPYYPNIGSTTLNINQSALNPAMSTVNYGQLEWVYSSRNGNIVSLLASFN